MTCAQNRKERTWKNMHSPLEYTFRSLRRQCKTHE